MSRYSEIRQKVTSTGKTYKVNPIYPELEDSDSDLYVITVEGDRFDKLSMQFYGRVQYWWVIAAVNSTEHADSLSIQPGTQLRIPADPEAYVLLYNQINS